MGLIKAAVNSVSTVMSDQWKEYFYCEAMPTDVLVTRGQKRSSAKSQNTKGSDNIISNGSVVVVNEGQCMMIVDQGAIVEFTAEAGEFTWDSSSEPSIFTGKLGDSIKQTFKTMVRRFTFGADTAKDQRVYYFNLHEIIGNKYGTANPVQFLVVDNNAGFQMEIGIKCFGEYSYKLTDPMLFYKNVCGNITSDFKRSQLDSQLKSELLTALQPALARISAKGIRYSEILLHTEDIADALNEELSTKWGKLRGISVSSFGINSLSANEDDEKAIKELQKSAALGNAKTASGYMVSATADAMRTAAGNEGGTGAMMGFMGMNMAQNTGSNVINGLFQQQANAPAAAAGWTCPSCGQQNNTGNFCAQCGGKKPLAKVPGGWDCACGAKNNTGKFCAECGAKRPAESDGWTCSCGAVNKGKFCAECGAKKPAGVPQYRCDKCGWEPEDMAHPPKFCPECGDPFDDGDII